MFDRDERQNYSILVVDDDPDIVEIVTLYLTNTGYRVYSAPNSAEALIRLQEITFDLIILDIMLPDLDGTGLCEQIRLSLTCPILFISCMDDEEHILQALHAGGDDYIRKPFYPKELVARVETNLRRVKLERGAGTVPTQIRIRDLVIDKKKYAVYKNGQEIVLSPIEFEILLYMIEHSHKTLHYAEIYKHVWQNDSLGDTRTVMVHVSKLRKKLEENDIEKYIKTVNRRGYLFLT